MLAVLFALFMQYSGYDYLANNGDVTVTDYAADGAIADQQTKRQGWSSTATARISATL